MQLNSNIFAFVLKRGLSIDLSIYRGFFTGRNNVSFQMKKKHKSKFIAEEKME